MHSYFTNLKNATPSHLDQTLLQKNSLEFIFTCLKLFLLNYLLKLGILCVA